MATFNNNADAYLEVMGEDSVIYVHYEPITSADVEIGEFTLIDELGSRQFFHKEHMLWKVPSEHSIDGRIFAAELQVTFVQYATDSQLIISFLFDESLSENV